MSAPNRKKLTKAQMKRLVLGVNGSYLMFGAPTACFDNELSDAESDAFQKAQDELARSMLKRAGLDRPMQAHEILAKLLAE